MQEHRETHSLRELADANRLSAAADDELRVARRRAAQDQRKSGSPAADWQIAESAHTRALADLAVAERSAQSAAQAAGASRSHYLTIHAKAQALRRLQEARREDVERGRDALERRESDELFLMRRGRGQAA
jgi:flagellar biosynthesis chaperone FliJ